MKTTITNYGIEYPQYFQGHSSLEFDHSVLGYGQSENEAFQNALEQMAEMDASNELINSIKHDYDFSDEEIEIDLDDDNWDNFPSHIIAIDWND